MPLILGIAGAFMDLGRGAFGTVTFGIRGLVLTFIFLIVLGFAELDGQHKIYSCPYDRCHLCMNL